MRLLSLTQSETDLFNIISSNDERDKDNEVVSRYSQVNVLVTYPSNVGMVTSLRLPILLMIPMITT